MDLRKLYQELYDSMYGRENTCERFTTNLDDDDDDDNADVIFNAQSYVNSRHEEPMHVDDDDDADPTKDMSNNSLAAPFIHNDITVASNDTELFIIEGVTTTSSDTEPFMIDGVTTASSDTETLTIDGATVTSSDTEPLIINGATVTSSDVESLRIAGVTESITDDTEVLLNDVNIKANLSFQMMGLYDENYAPDLYESDEYE